MGNRGFNSSQFLESSHRAIRKSDPLLPVAAAVVRVDGRTRPAGGIADPQDPVQSRRRAGQPPLSDPRRRTSGLGSGLDDLWRSAIFGRHPLRSSSHVLIASACVRRYRFWLPTASYSRSEFGANPEPGGNTKQDSDHSGLCTSVYQPDAECYGDKPDHGSYDSADDCGERANGTIPLGRPSILRA